MDEDDKLHRRLRRNSRLMIVFNALLVLLTGYGIVKILSSDFSLLDVWLLVLYCGFFPLNLWLLIENVKEFKIWNSLI